MWCFLFLVLICMVGSVFSIYKSFCFPCFVGNKKQLDSLIATWTYPSSYIQFIFFSAEAQCCHRRSQRGGYARFQLYWDWGLAHSVLMCFSLACLELRCLREAHMFYVFNYCLSCWVFYLSVDARMKPVPTPPGLYITAQIFFPSCTYRCSLGS